MIPKFAITIFVIALLFTSQFCLADDKLDKLTPEQLNELSVKLWKDGKYTDPKLAIKYADLAIAKDPNYGRAYYTKGFAYYNLKKYDISIENFTKAISLDPNIEESYNGRGWVYGTIDDYENAIRDFTKAIEINPQYKLAYNNRAMAYLHIDQNDMACADFQKVCDLGNCNNIKHAKKIGKCR